MSTVSFCFPLTQSQKRLWYVEKMNPQAAVHNIGGSIIIDGPIDIHLLEKSIKILIIKNDALRIRMTESGGEPQQFIVEHEEPAVPCIDFSQHAEPEQELEKWTNIAATAHMELYNAPLYWFSVFKLAEDKIGYFVKLHHIISDAWSMQILTSQMEQIYVALQSGDEVFQQVEHSYRESCLNERKYMESVRFNKDRNYWIDKLEPLPESFLHKSSTSMAGMRTIHKLDQATVQNARQFVRQHDLSMNTFFVAATLIYMHKLLRQSDMVIGTPVLNRTGKKEKSTFGMFVSTMPLRIKIDGKLTIMEFMKCVQSELTKSYFHQKYPYNLLAQDLQLAHKGYDQLFQICVNYHNAKLVSDFAGYKADNKEFYNQHSLYALHLMIKEWTDADDLHLEIDYKREDYSSSQIQDFITRILLIIHGIMENPHACFNELSLVAENEKQLVLEAFNATPLHYGREKTLHQLFQEQASRTPHSTAVVCEETKLSYAELHQQSSQFAMALQAQGVKPGMIVPIMLDRSLDLIIAIWAVLKTGAAYLPIDPDYPGERVQYMLDNSGASMMLSSRRLSKDGLNGVECTYVEDIQTCSLHSEYGSSSVSSDLAYMIYTSGSTGKPKGVMIEHRNVHNFIEGIQQLFAFGPQHRICSLTTISFDIFVLESILPLCKGSTVVLASDREVNHLPYLNDCLQRNSINVLQTTPSRMNVIVSDGRCLSGLSQLEALFVGGEELPSRLVTKLRAVTAATIFNMYGPTETTVWSTAQEIRSDDSHTIGKPLANTQVYIVDQYEQPMPPGYAGELCIAGEGVSRGYFNNAELTSQRFVNNPVRLGEAMYKTGDMAKWLHDGTLAYIGRIEHEMKLNGYRMDTSEIEAEMENFGAIQRAVAVIHEMEDGRKAICAYYVCQHSIEDKQLRQYLARKIPRYMIPAIFMRVNEFKLTPSGKIDRKSLPLPIRPSNDSNSLMLENKINHPLVDILKGLLGVTAVGLDDDFYSLGGDSVKAIQLASRLHDAGISLDVQHILTASTVFDLIELSVELAQKKEMIPNPGEREYIRISNEHAAYLREAAEGIGHRTRTISLNLKVDYDQSTLSLMLNRLIRKHDSLRINRDGLTGTLFYNSNHLFRDYGVELTTSTVADPILSKIDVDRDPLIKLYLNNQIDTSKQKLFIVLHQWAADHASIEIILRDILQWMEAGGIEDSPVDVAGNQRLFSKLDSLQTKAIPSCAEINMNQDHSFNGCESESYCFSAEKTEQLLAACQTYGAALSELAISMLSAARSSILNNQHQTISMVSDDRVFLEKMIGTEIQGMVGCVRYQYPIHIQQTSFEYLSEQIEHMKHLHRGVSLEEVQLVWPDFSIDDGSINAVFQYLSSLISEQLVDNPYFSIVHLDNEPSSSKYVENSNVFAAVAKLDAKSLILTVDYKHGVACRDTAVKILDDWVRRLNEVILQYQYKDTSTTLRIESDVSGLSNADLNYLFD
ncbi:Surfactin synthase subunit 1 [Paenibacillus plantiphilus]|uniref:Surfactin synthase subunit 1 n=1 Tax=Paenibacillus plantiphilus TaxID=2905650 RepID=A0ABN8GG76_9BACL|nr:amino acid adenylation domain-containing protein [Paenibacillus plantiphilus]CAH1206490.1 Surfactin synthase subunit 1 [Paenibacillus plantiphilus]